MLEVKINPKEMKEYVKTLPKIKEKVFDLVRTDMKTMSSDLINSLMEAELRIFLGRDRHERQTALSVTQRNYRNGHYIRSFALKGVGSVSLKVPRDRKGLYKNGVLERYQRQENAIKEDVAMLYLMGTSTRGLSLISEKLLGKKISHSQVSQCTSAITNAVEKWRTRPLEEDFKYLYLDGTNFKMRVRGRIERVSVLAVIGVTETGHKKVIALQAGDKESASNWRELFKELKARGLDKKGIKLGIMDGLPGLEKVFEEEFPRAKIQRCQVHVARNILSKVPWRIRKEVADDVRSIFYCQSKKKAEEFLKAFRLKWGKEIPSAVKCLELSSEKTLRYLDFPEDEWVSLRTTNAIERLNKEFKRRTKSMEIVAGESSCYNLLAVISIRMEAHWRNHPITFQKAMPFWKSRDEFTQKC